MAVLKKTFRKLLFPGFDIHTRSRAILCKYWNFKGKTILDAGCGNGYFVKLAHDAGAKHAVGISFDDKNTIKANEFFKKEIENGSMSFKTVNLYEMENHFEKNSFDAIICYETLEHLMDDVKVVRSFYNLLKPGGVIHVSAPNKYHIEHSSRSVSETEDGWHVREGYDKEDFTRLLENAGFKVNLFAGVGNMTTYKTDNLVREMRNRYGHVLAFPFFITAIVINNIRGYGCKDLEKAFTIYARAVK